MKARTAGAWTLCAIAVPFLMRYELHTDDTGIEVGLLFLTTAILGFLHPRRAWVWALLVGPAIPLADVLFGKPTGFLPIAAVTTTISLVGSYAGALASRFARPAPRQS